jgi:gliding motility-associated-like protein
LKTLKYIFSLLLVALSFSTFAVDKGTKLRYICLSQSDSIATINWNQVTDGCASFKSYDIYGREDNFSLFQFMKSVPNIATTSTTLKLPNLKTWQFYIVVHSACNGVDSFHSDTLSIDIQEPAPWSLDSVSVDFNTQKVMAGWSAHSDSDVLGYYVYYVTSTNDRISDNNDLFFLGSNEDPTTGPISYSIAAYDTCLNTSPISPFHRTMYLTHSFDTCTGVTSLNWTRYIGWNTIQEYRIYASTNSSLYSIVGTVDGNTTSFNAPGITPGDTVCYFIRAVNGDNNAITSSSNINCQYYKPLTKPSKLYISNVSVVNHSNIEIRCIHDSSIETIELFKRTLGGAWSSFYSYSPTVEDTTLLDLTLDVNTERAEYRMVSYDVCNRPTDTSNISTNILLEWQVDDLSWNYYYSFMAGSTDYDILSNFPGSTWNIELLTLDSFYLQPTQTDIDGNAKCFCIRIIESAVNAFSIQDTSYSNQVCAVADISIYFPTAFVPNGVNAIYKPVGVNISPENYLLQIINRWGEIVFESTDPNVGWDGTYNSEFCQMGVYAYRYTAKSLEGTNKAGSGSLHLIRKQ